MTGRRIPTPPTGWNENDFPDNPDGMPWRHGPFGAFLDRHGTDGSHWMLCCPGCGEVGSPRDGQQWQCVAGSFDDVTTLTLSPSIAKSCCGWHGHLRGGVFESC